MENAVKYFETIDLGFKKMKFVVWAVLIFSLLVILGTIGWCLSAVSSSQDRVYILDKGQAFSAGMASGNSYRGMEVNDHVSRFHELFFRLSPSKEAITRNVDEALMMCDKSAYDYYMDLSEKEYFARMINANISQDFSIDSLHVNVTDYPYSARLFGKMYVLRESSITAYDFISSCNIIDVERSVSNPHGLMMEKFKIEKNEKIASRKRF